MPVETPRHLTEAQIREMAEEAETLYDFTREARIGRGLARRLLAQLDLSDQVATAEDLS